MSGIWAIVPVKEFEGAKQRLSPALSADERRVLAATMLEDVLDALSAVRELAGLLVVTIDPAATALAARYGARIVAEGARDGHTGAVTAAARLLVREGQGAMMTMPGDIPRATSAEIAATVAAHRAAPAFTIVPAHDDLGSNTIRHVAARRRSAALRRGQLHIPISTRRERAGSNRWSCVTRGSGWISTIPSISSRF